MMVKCCARNKKTVSSRHSCVSPPQRTLFMKRIRIGVIGCGNVLSAYRASLEKLRSAGVAETTFACGRAAQAEEARKALGAVRFTTEAEVLLKSAEVDVVLILTSMKEHA